MADNVELVRGAYEALARGDAGGVLEPLDENVEWHEAEHIPYWPGGPFIGPQAVLERVLARIPEDFDNFTVDVQRLVGCGETVLVEARYRDGKVVRWQQYSDTWQFAEVMGFVPTLAETPGQLEHHRFGRGAPRARRLPCRIQGVRRASISPESGPSPPPCARCVAPRAPS